MVSPLSLKMSMDGWPSSEDLLSRLSAFILRETSILSHRRKRNYKKLLKLARRSIAVALCVIILLTQSSTADDRIIIKRINPFSITDVENGPTDKDILDKIRNGINGNLWRFL